LKNYYKKLKDSILKDVDAKLSQPLEEKAAERIKKDLDIATECQDFIDGDAESEFDNLPPKIQNKINKIIEEYGNNGKT